MALLLARCELRDVYNVYKVLNANEITHLSVHLFIDEVHTFISEVLPESLRCSIEVESVPSSSTGAVHAIHVWIIMK